MKIKIVSDGTSTGTKVISAKTGETIENIRRIEWVLNAKDMYAVAKIEVVLLAAEMQADAVKPPSILKRKKS